MPRSSWLALLLIACGPTTPEVTAPAPGPGPGSVVTAPPVAAPFADPIAADGVHLASGITVGSYDVTLTIDPAQPTFTGSIKISATLDQARRDVVLHAHELSITRAAVMAEGYGSALTATPAGPGRMRFVAEGEIPAGPITLSIDYAGTINDNATHGAFRQEDRGQWYAFSQLEAVYARQVFPCVDEPGVKVPWTLTLVVPASQVAISNTPIATERAEGANRRVTFATTPPLPSYLVAFAVGPFEPVSAGTSTRGTPLTIYALAGRAADAKAAVEITPKVFAWLEDWFGVPFPYPKLDAVPIPITVGFGAMENPGMITYRADILLLPATAGEERKRTYSYYAAHEIAHQWFGDLVTPTWWDDLWLNESFATWLPGKTLSAIYPEWIQPTAFVEHRSNSLWADSLGTVRRIREPIRSEDDIHSAFDGITYGKGASVLRMFERHAGEDAFRTGVQRYLEKHAHKTATAADFLASVSAATGVDVTTTMSTFLDQPGAPKLSATLTCEGSRAKIAITQGRYLPLGAAPPSGAAPVWKIPVCVAYGARGVKAGAAGARSLVCGLVGESTVVLEGDGCTPDAWLYANAGAAGYYRTSIGDGLDRLLADGWRHLSPSERLAVAQDVQAAVVAGEADMAAVLALVPRLVAESETAPTTFAVKAIESIERFLPANDPAVARWVRTHLGKRARSLGWLPKKGEPIHAADLRGHVVPLVAALGADPALRKQAVALARDWRKVPEAIRTDVMRVAVRAEPALADAWREAYVAETDRVVRKDLARAIARVPDRARVEAALAIALDPKVDVRDASRLIYEAARETTTQPWAEAWTVANLDALLARIPSEVGADLVEVIASGCDPERVAPMRAVADAKIVPLPGGPRAVDQAFERVAQCIATRHALEPALAAWRKTLR